VGADERLHYDTTALNTVKELTITRGHRIRRLQVMGWEPEFTLAGHISRMEVEVNEGEYHPVTIDNILEWCWQNKRDYNLECEITRYPFLYGGAINHWVDANMCYPLCFNGNAFDNVPTGVIGCRTRPPATGTSAGVLSRT